MSVRAILFVIIFWILFLPHKTYAHLANASYTFVTIDEKNIRLSYTTLYDNILSYYPEKGKTIEEIKLDFFAKQFKKSFLITNNGEYCDPHLVNYKNKTDVKLVEYVFTIECKEKPDNLRFEYNLFFDISKYHQNIAKFSVGRNYEEFLFTQTNKTFDLETKNNNIQNQLISSISGGLIYFKLGVNHIFVGYDHILFLLSLLLMTASMKHILKIITSFTLAHSITLIIAALGIFILPTRIAEAMIALSIVYVAGENLFILSKHKLSKKYNFFSFFGDTSKRRGLTFLFGLIHGFGFSYILKEVGLPKDGLIESLLLFNLGIEFGQLCIVLLLFPLLWYIRQKKKHNQIVIISSACIMLVGLIWFIQRVVQ